MDSKFIMETGKIRVLIAEDHTLTAHLLGKVLAKFEIFEIIGIVSDGFSLLEELDAKECDIVLLDLSMPELNGIDAMEIINRRHPLVKVLVLTAHCDGKFIETTLELGVSGYVTKKADTNELVHAIKIIYNGGFYLDSMSLHALLYDYNPAENDLV